MGADSAFSVQDVRGTSVTVRPSVEGPRVEVGEAKEGGPLMEVTFPMVDGKPTVRVRSREWHLASGMGPNSSVAVRPFNRKE